MSCAAVEYACAVRPNSCQSVRTVSMRGFTSSRTWFASVMAWPMTSPLPRNDSATAESTELSFVGSITWTTDCRFSNTVLTSTVTFCDCSTAPDRRWPALGPLEGTFSSTYLAPNAVLDRICASTFPGNCANGPGYIRSFSVESTCPAVSVRLPIDSTSPIWTPRSFTFAPSSITRPARSEIKVNGTNPRKDPENSSHVIAVMATTRITKTGAHQIGSICSRRDPFAPFAIGVQPARWKLPDCP